MKELTSARNLETFMLRLDRVSPGKAISGGFDLALAAAVLEAHLDFIAGLDLTALSSTQARVVSAITQFRREAQRFRTGLMRVWLSRTLSSASKKTQEALECIADVYARALELGHLLMSLLIPCSTSWYDATIGRRSKGRRVVVAVR